MFDAFALATAEAARSDVRPVTAPGLGRHAANYMKRAAIARSSMMDEACLSSAVARVLVDAVAACTSKAADVLSSDGALILASRQCPELRLISFDDAFCAVDGPCPPVIGNVVVYRDAHHMTATYSATLAPALSRRLRAALPGIL